MDGSSLLTLHDVSALLCVIHPPHLCAADNLDLGCYQLVPLSWY